jgi:hypothetical protein
VLEVGTRIYLSPDVIDDGAHDDVLAAVHNVLFDVLQRGVD